MSDSTRELQLQSTALLLLSDFYNGVETPKYFATILTLQAATILPWPSMLNDSPHNSPRSSFSSRFLYRKSDFCRKMSTSPHPPSALSFFSGASMSDSHRPGCIRDLRDRRRRRRRRKGLASQETIRIQRVRDSAVWIGFCGARSSRAETAGATLFKTFPQRRGQILKRSCRSLDASSTRNTCWLPHS